MTTNGVDFSFFLSFFFSQSLGLLLGTEAHVTTPNSIDLFQIPCHLSFLLSFLFPRLGG